LRSFDKNSILIGDINLPSIDWEEEKTDAKGRELLHAVIEEGLQQLVSVPTHTKGNTLDLVITNCPDKVLEVDDVGRLGKSDHCMISITVECQPREVKEKENVRYNWKRADMPAIRSELEGKDWERELSRKTMEEGWTWFREQLQSVVEKYVPKSSSRTKLKNPWMTREILRLIRKKRKVWKKAKYSSLAEDMAEYKRIEKEVSNKIRNAKRKLEKDLVSGPDKKNRNFARYVKTKTKSRTTIGPLITKDKRVLTEEKDMAEELNKFFSSVFTREDLTNIPEPEKEQVQSRMKEIRVSKGEIKKKIQKLRKEAAAGPDGIKPRLLQQLEDSILLPLEILFNRSLETGEIPQEWRTAKVTPIFKKGAKGDPGNYRPVSLTSVPCK
jgi:hypothetical protein